MQNSVSFEGTTTEILLHLFSQCKTVSSRVAQLHCLPLLLLFHVNVFYLWALAAGKNILIRTTNELNDSTNSTKESVVDYMFCRRNTLDAGRASWDSWENPMSGSGVGYMKKQMQLFTVDVV